MQRYCSAVAMGIATQVGMSGGGLAECLVLDLQELANTLVMEIGYQWYCSRRWHSLLWSRDLLVQET